MSNLDNETRKDGCPCDCWVESCLECTCCRCKDVWTEGTENTCEGSCEDCACEKCSCEECTCKECCAVWEETVCDPSGECTCEECCCKECTCKEWCDAWEETICGSGMECTCEECCAPNNKTSEEYDYYFPIDNSGNTQEPEVVEDDTGEYIEGDEYDNYEDTDDDYVYDPAEDGNEIEIVDDRHYDTPIVRLVDYTRYMQIGDEFTFTAREAMSTQNRRIVWSSSDPAIIEIEENTGIATAHKEGTAIILATTYDFEIEEFCEVVVDKRELVTVTRVIDEKDDYFTVTFKDGKVWKSIGCDMEDSNNRSGLAVWEEKDELLKPCEARHKKNVGLSYTNKQLALLYRLDPYGVVAYVKDYLYRRKGFSLESDLRYKDSLYLAIFGMEEYNYSNFFFKVNDEGVIQYYRHSAYQELNRLHIHSKAELIFGAHSYIDPVCFLNGILEGFLKAVFDYVIEKIKPDDGVYDAMNICGSFFFSRAITNGTEAAVKQLWESVGSEEILIEELKKRLPIWARFLLVGVKIFSDALQNAYFPNQVKDLTIYQNVELAAEDLNYMLLMKNEESELTLCEIVNMLTNK